MSDNFKPKKVSSRKSELQLREKEYIKNLEEKFNNFSPGTKIRHDFYDFHVSSDKLNVLYIVKERLGNSIFLENIETGIENVIDLRNEHNIEFFENSEVVESLKESSDLFRPKKLHTRKQEEKEQVKIFATQLSKNDFTLLMVDKKPCYILEYALQSMDDLKIYFFVYSEQKSEFRFSILPDKQTIKIHCDSLDQAVRYTKDIFLNDFKIPNYLKESSDPFKPKGLSNRIQQKNKSKEKLQNEISSIQLPEKTLDNFSILYTDRSNNSKSKNPDIKNAEINTEVILFIIPSSIKEVIPRPLFNHCTYISKLNIFTVSSRNKGQTYFPNTSYYKCKTKEEAIQFAKYIYSQNKLPPRFTTKEIFRYEVVKQIIEYNKKKDIKESRKINEEIKNVSFTDYATDSLSGDTDELYEDHFKPKNISGRNIKPKFILRRDEINYLKKILPVGTKYCYVDERNKIYVVIKQDDKSTTAKPYIKNKNGLIHNLQTVTNPNYYLYKDLENIIVLKDNDKENFLKDELNEDSGSNDISTFNTNMMTKFNRKIYRSTNDRIADNDKMIESFFNPRNINNREDQKKKEIKMLKKKFKDFPIGLKFEYFNGLDSTVYEVIRKTKDDYILVKDLETNKEVILVVDFDINFLKHCEIIE